MRKKAVKINLINLKQERLNKEWTLECVGKQIGVTKTAIHDIETLRRKPSYDVLVKLENLFDKDHRYLFAQVSDTEQQNYSKSDSGVKAEVA